MNVFGYYPEWAIYDRKYRISDIDGSKITHLMYAFMVPNPNLEDYNKLKKNYAYPIKQYHPEYPEGTLVPHDTWAWKQNYEELKAFRLKYPKVKIIGSVGGWSLSWHFSSLFKKPEAMKHFVDSAYKVFDWDGIDIDWEYVGHKGASYNTFDIDDDYHTFANICRALKEKYPDKLLTAAMSANPEIIKEYAGGINYLDFLLLMTYDYFGHDLTIGDHTRIDASNDEKGFYAKKGVKTALDLGFPRDKICIGTPFYARGWKMEGLFATSLADNHYFGAGQVGMMDYRFLMERKGLHYTMTYDKSARFKDAETNELWSYESRDSLRTKCRFIKDEKLAGIIIWSLDGDARTGPTLLDVIDEELLCYEEDEEEEEEDTKKRQPEDCCCCKTLKKMRIVFE
jgi:chitinase